MTSTTGAIYTRISRDRDGTTLGVKRQEKLCREIAEARGIHVVEVFTDNDVSATARKKRPGYERMLDDLRAGRFSVVIALDSDRLLRRPMEFEQLAEIGEPLGARIEYQGNRVDFRNGDGLLEARVRAAVDAEEVAKLKKRVKRKAEELAAAGKVGGGGSRPFGYDDDRVTVRENEAELIRDAARRVLAGESVRGIAKDWNAREVRTPTGGEWVPSVLRRLLCSGRIAGLREHHGKVAADAVWNAIIDRPTHERLRAVLLDPARAKFNGTTARRYLLTGGVARCGLCGSKLVARPRADKERCYVCASGPGFGGCGKIRVLAKPLEALVVEVLIYRLDSPAVRDALDPSEPDEDRKLTAEIEAIDARLDELAAAFADGTMTMRQVRVATAKLEARRSDAVKALAARSRDDLVAALDADLTSTWDEMPFDRRHAIVAAIIDRITVNPAVRGRNRFDPERVEISWRA